MSSFTTRRLQGVVLRKHMGQCCLKKWPFKKVSFKSKSKWTNGQELIMINMPFFSPVFFFVLYVNLENEK